MRSGCIKQWCNQDFSTGMEAKGEKRPSGGGGGDSPPPPPPRYREILEYSCIKMACFPH